MEAFLISIKTKELRYDRKKDLFYTSIGILALIDVTVYIQDTTLTFFKKSVIVILNIFLLIIILWAWQSMEKLLDEMEKEENIFNQQRRETQKENERENQCLEGHIATDFDH